MEAFWGKLKEKLNKKTELGVGTLACDMRLRAKKHNKYGRIRVTWHDGSKCTERAHRVAYMTEHKVLYEEICQEKKTRSVQFMSQ